MDEKLFKSLGLISSKSDAQYHDAVALYDAMHGKYAGNVSVAGGEAHLLPTVQMPMAAQHVPYSVKGVK